MASDGLGRRVPGDWIHVEKYPIRATMPKLAPSAERILKLPGYRKQYDQGREGACVGYASSWCMSILNRKRYDAQWLYEEAQDVDEWSDTPPESGTSVRAAMDVLRDVGHRQIYWGISKSPDPKHGIRENRWAKTVDEVRTCIQSGVPVVLGVNWYSAFDAPKDRNLSPVIVEYWIGDGNLGSVRGGHAICAYGVSDKRQAVKLVNSWGFDYPLVWMPYTTLQRLLNESGEATVITDVT